MRMTNRQARQLVNAAVNSGITPPWRRPYWRQAIAGGGPAAGRAIAQLLAMHPAPPDVAAAWRRDPRNRRTAAAQADPADLDQVYDTLWPSPQQLAAELERQAQAQDQRAGSYVQPGKRTDNKLRLPEAQAGAVTAHTTDPDEPLLELTHGPATVEHSHPHAAYDGTVHDHPHIHRGDALHRAGAGHAHPQPPVDAAAAGIAAKVAERARRGDPRAAETDQELLTRLFGKPAGQ
jgi:hypothetical protein